MTQAENALIRLHQDDHVAVVKNDVVAGAILPGGLVAATDVPAGHKIALRSATAGEPILKYGQPIGQASAPIAAGEHVHVHNLAAERTIVDEPTGNGDPGLPEAIERSFMGFRRKCGSVGTRNYIGVLASVNCSSTVVRRIVRHFADERLAAFPNVDGIVPITHTTGCGQSASGPGIDILRRTLGGFARHPNFGGILIIGLGCEVNQTDVLLHDQRLTPSERLRTLTIQDVGGTAAAIEAGIRNVEELCAIVNEDRRECVSASNLVLGLQCGGSDAWSGVSANPSLGAASDLLVRAGGSVLLAETPEIYGAEQLLTARSVAPEVTQALLDRLSWWEDYVAKNGQQLDNNPSPGNVAGGLSTIIEKSLGAVAKAGTSPLRGVLRYGEPIREPGLHFMDSPGYDPCSVTGEIASGATIVCFTTGRGSVFGAKPTPSLKLASNARVATHMEDDIDADCSAVIEGTRTPADLGGEIFALILRTASGELSKSERHGFGDFEFVPWQIGAFV